MVQLEELRLQDDWLIRARREQIPPPGNWSIWGLLGGRGIGKTRSGAEWVRREVRRGVRRVAMVAPTAADARDVMVEGESGILAVCDDFERPEYEVTKRRLTWPNGAIATLFSAEQPERLRGPQHEIAWCDEIATWRYLQSTWDNLMLGLRLGKRTRVMFTTTPKPLKLLKELKKRSLAENPSVIIGTGSTYDNLDNLSPTFREEVLRTYQGTRLERQEIYGELLEDYEGALWSYALLERQRTDTCPESFDKIVVAVDPATSSGESANHTGIVVVGKYNDRAFVLEDKTLRGKPALWAKTAIVQYHTWAKRSTLISIVAEKNQGGEMITHTIHSIDPDVKVELVHASKGKAARAEPVATQYEAGNVFHVGMFPELEEEQTSYIPGDTVESPNRLDACVWGVTKLMIGRRKILGTWGRRAAA